MEFDQSDSHHQRTFAYFFLELLNTRVGNCILTDVVVSYPEGTEKGRIELMLASDG